MYKRLFVGVLLLLCVGVVAAQTERDIIGPDSYPAGVNPLTGLLAENPEDLNRRPIIIKISNFPPFVREYQMGLNDAAIVWEHLLAGGVTRFSALFWEGEYEQIGPIRSGRLVDFELLRLYNSLLTFSGLSEGTLSILRQDALVASRAVAGSGPCPPLCRYPQDGLALEHTLFANTAQLRDLAVERDADLEPDPIRGMAFSEAAPEGGTALDTMTIRYREMLVDWAWDAASERWLRSTDGEAHFDQLSGEQVNAANVVVIEEEHTVQPFVRDQFWGPANFAYSTNFIGSGRIFLLRDGLVYEGEWRRDVREDPLTFYDTEGNLLPFKPGNTFFNLVPRWIDGYELEIKLVEPPQVSVAGDFGVSMHYGPSDAYRAPDVAYAGDTFNVLGRKWDSSWLQVQRNDERAVWLPVERLDVGDLDIESLPVPRPTNERG